MYTTLIYHYDIRVHPAGCDIDLERNCTLPYWENIASRV